MSASPENNPAENATTSEEDLSLWDKPRNVVSANNNLLSQLGEHSDNNVLNATINEEEDTITARTYQRSADIQKERRRFSFLSLLGGNRIEHLALISCVIPFLLFLLFSFFQIRALENEPLPSQLNSPHKAEHLVIEKLESYWRDANHGKGANDDIGVPERFQVIPEIILQIAPKSEARSLRLLFRDERNTFVGDSSTIELRSNKIQPGKFTNVKISKDKLVIHATKGLEHANELISYQTDQNFTWEFVILESQDGKKFTEAFTIPISSYYKIP